MGVEEITQLGLSWQGPESSPQNIRMNMQTHKCARQWQRSIKMQMTGKGWQCRVGQEREDPCIGDIIWAEIWEKWRSMPADNVSRGRNVPDRWKSKHVLVLGVFGDRWEEGWGNTEAHRLLDHLKPWKPVSSVAFCAWWNGSALDSREQWHDNALDCT